LREKHILRVFESRVLRRIFGPKRDEELNDLYSSPNIIPVIKSRMRWTGHIARGRERRGAKGVLWRIPREIHHLEDLDVNGRIMLKRIFKKWEGRHGLDLAQDRYRWWALVNAVMNLRVT
jgi:hypothetical protein